MEYRRKASKLLLFVVFINVAYVQAMLKTSLKCASTVYRGARIAKLFWKEESELKIVQCAAKLEHKNCVTSLVDTKEQDFVSQVLEKMQQPEIPVSGLYRYKQVKNPDLECPLNSYLWGARGFGKDKVDAILAPMYVRAARAYILLKKNNSNLEVTCDDFSLHGLPTAKDTRENDADFECLTYVLGKSHFLDVDLKSLIEYSDLFLQKLNTKKEKLSVVQQKRCQVALGAVKRALAMHEAAIMHSVGRVLSKHNKKMVSLYKTLPINLTAMALSTATCMYADQGMLASFLLGYVVCNGFQSSVDFFYKNKLEKEADSYIKGRNALKGFCDFCDLTDLNVQKRLKNNLSNVWGLAQLYKYPCVERLYCFSVAAPFRRLPAERKAVAKKMLRAKE